MQLKAFLACTKCINTVLKKLTISEMNRLNKINTIITSMKMLTITSKGSSCFGKRKKAPPPAMIRRYFMEKVALPIALE